jgi:hypothetical protein
VSVFTVAAFVYGGGEKEDGSKEFIYHELKTWRGNI